MNTEIKLIETRCFLIDSKMEGLGVNVEDTMARTVFLASDVAGMRELKNDNEEGISDEQCMVYFKNGNSLQVDCPYDEMFELVYGVKPELTKKP